MLSCSSVHTSFPGKNTGLGCYFLLQEIFLTQGQNLSFYNWQADFLPLFHLGSPLLGSMDVLYLGLFSSVQLLSHVGLFATP